ncbi:MAG: dihydropteroate synthase [Candidatus Omnitrophica bacterium]|nr:dihydropteroate synthase [Candidatus Omnitrophota bacterium]
MIHILGAPDQKELTRQMRRIKVDPYGIKIMLPKALAYPVKISALSNIAANILKQEMLSLGGDVAIARGALTGKSQKTDCLLIGNLAQFSRLNEKLNRQPFGLNRLAAGLSAALGNYQKDKFSLELGSHRLNLSRRTNIMGILNLTPDSFSADGLYPSCVDKAVKISANMVKDGADIIDVGGQSSRPGARPVSIKEELARIVPIIKVLSKRIKAPISIDTYKPEVAKAALDNGAVMVNDITALRNPKMAKLIARYKAAVVLMHMKGNPLTMQKNPAYVSLIDEIIEYLDKAIAIAAGAGIDREKIIVDPGIGFGKALRHNLEILKELRQLKVLGRPILVGPSRKSFIGKILNLEPQERVFGSVSSCVLAAENGADMVRVHDVKAVKQALKIIDRVNK